VALMGSNRFAGRGFFPCAHPVQGQRREQRTACCLIEADTEKNSWIDCGDPVASPMRTPWCQPWDRKHANKALPGKSSVRRNPRIRSKRSWKCGRRPGIQARRAGRSCLDDLNELPRIWIQWRTPARRLYAASRPQGQANQQPETKSPWCPNYEATGTPPIPRLIFPGFLLS
jgi:hypothetical protein